MILRPFMILATALVARAGEFPTNFLTSLEKCLKPGKTHCLADNLKDSACCDYAVDSTEHAECVGKYRMCSHNLKFQVYREMTMPPFSCPNSNIPFSIHHTAMYKK